MTTAAIDLRDVRKDFGSFTALRQVSFDIADNEFFTLLGPSGCGKTTLLRMIAGFEATTAGSIHLYGEEIASLPPNKRPVNTVFQNYALFPHMSVGENIAFSLQMLNWGKAEIAARVTEMVAMVQLDQFVHRKPSQLSGGQQQRVALARAMAPRPKVLLLDEPLSALDLKLRQEMRTELKRLQVETGITFIFVTHDQEEALSMSDRIAVMSAGQVQQIGTPWEIYENPTNKFVADFIGDTNLIDARVIAIDDQYLTCALNDDTTVRALPNAAVKPDQRGSLSLRPEHLRLSKTKASGDSMKGTLGEAMYLGTDTQFVVDMGKGFRLRVRQQNSLQPQDVPSKGEPVFVSIADQAARFLVD